MLAWGAAARRRARMAARFSRACASASSGSRSGSPVRARNEWLRSLPPAETRIRSAWAIWRAASPFFMTASTSSVSAPGTARLVKMTTRRCLRRASLTRAAYPRPIGSPVPSVIESPSATMR